MKPLVLKSARASLFITLGVGVLLTIGNPIGPFLFALGLLAVCVINDGHLFTGLCGYIHDKKSFKDGMIVLLLNLVYGYMFGIFLSIANPALKEVAIEKVTSWSDISLIGFFIRSFFCGVVMFTAVDMKKKGTMLGIIYGIPLFIFCGFQHSIANIITCGVANSIHYTIPIAIAGNWLGSYITRKLS